MSSTALGCASSLTNISHGGLYIIYIPLKGLLNPYNARYAKNPNQPKLKGQSYRVSK